MGKSVTVSLSMVVEPYQDLAPQKDIGGGADSWFLVAHVLSDSDNEYTFLIHCLTRGHGDYRVTVCISDITNKQYISQITKRCVMAPKENGIHFTAEGLAWDICEQSMRVKAELEKGKYEMELAVEGDGTVFGYNSTGQLPFFGKEGQNIQYAFPNLQVKGKLITDDKMESVEGEGWLDRQWGPLPFEKFLQGKANGFGLQANWIMAVILPSGVPSKIAVPIIGLQSSRQKAFIRLHRSPRLYWILAQACGKAGRAGKSGLLAGRRKSLLCILI